MFKTKAKNLIKKGPQLLIATLLTVYPLFLLIASSAYAGVQPVQLQQRMLQVEALQRQANSYLGQIQQKIRSSSAPTPISVDTLSDLESSIQSLKAQGANTSNLETLFSSLKSKISIYNETLTTYTSSLLDQESKKTALDLAIQTTATATQQLATAQDNLQIATSTLEAAQAAFSSADASLTSQIQITKNTLETLNTSQGNLSTATSNLDSAKSSHLSAEQQLNNATSNKNEAYEAYLNSEVLTPASNGLHYQTYTIPTDALPNPSSSTPGAEPCTSGTVPNIDHDWGGGIILGCRADFVLIHYYGYIKFPTSGSYTFYAPADDGFYITINSTTVINDWSLKPCMGTSTGTLEVQADTYYPISAWAYEWGGGACTVLTYLEGENWSVIPSSLYYLDTPTTTRDPNLYEIYQNAIATYEQALQNLAAAALALGSATSNYSSAKSEYTICLANYEAEVAIQTQLEQETSTKKSELDLAQSNYNTATTELSTAQKALDDATLAQTTAQNIYDSSVVTSSILESLLTSHQSDISNLTLDLSTAISNTQIPTQTPTPTPTPTQTPTEPTTTETYTQEQRDELLEAAQADDIQVPEELAAIPVLGAVATSLVDAVNFVGNAGADLSPEERKKAQQTVVSTLIVGQVAQTAAAAASASASASRSSSTRKIK